MICVSATRTRFVFRPEFKEESHTAFVFNFSDVPLKPIPKYVLFLSKLPRRAFRTTWKQFGKETVFRSRDKRQNDICLVRKEKMRRVRRDEIGTLKG